MKRELHDLPSLRNIIRVIKSRRTIWTEPIKRMGYMRSAYKIFRWGPVAGSCEHDNELSGSIKGKEFLDWLSGC
jgi:hypothetical protein